MTEENKGLVPPEQPTEPEVKVEDKVETPPETPPTEKPAVEQPEDDAEQPVKNNLEKRFSKITKEKYEARAEADYWKQRAIMADPNLKQQQPQQPTQPVSTAKPTMAQYGNDVDKYVEALTDWKIQQTEVQRHNQQLVDTFLTRVSEFEKQHPDYKEVVAQVDSVPVAGEITALIAESNVGPAMAYHLAQNPQEIERLNRLSPVRRAAELGKLEATFSTDQTDKEQPKPAAKPVKPVKPAPAPVTPVQGNVPTRDKPVHEMTAQEYNAHLAKQDRMKLEAQKAKQRK